ncbi:MAG: adenylate kinase [Lachnospiraceae bacterium]|nr:adenylate kinase [Lachnospiraceae bacterium]
MNIVMLGAPGAGKGTIAAQMNQRYNIPHISTGDIFRANIKEQTEIGKLAKSYIDKGELVPDEVTIKMMLNRIDEDDCKNGYILDGFPRSINQAKGLDDALNASNSKIDLVLLVDASDEQIIERLSGRRVCDKCGSTYHLTNMPPKKEGVCDKCGGEVIQRKDDDAKVILDRLKTYHTITKPLEDYYIEKNLLKKVSGFVDSQEERLKQIDKLLNL